MSNKSAGNLFESKIAELLSFRGFWVHRFTQNSAGQPADIVAVKNGFAYLIDCKHCDNDFFSSSRIEYNQQKAMEKWASCGNGQGYFCIGFEPDNSIYMVDIESLQNYGHSQLSKYFLELEGCTLERWLLYANRNKKS